MVSLPVAADIRRARAVVTRGMRPVLEQARGPVLIVFGAGRTVGDLARSLPSTRADRDRDTPDSALSAPPTPGELRERGEAAWERLLERPEAADLISRSALVAANLAQWLEDTADELHDRSEELLARLDNLRPRRDQDDQSAPR